MPAPARPVARGKVDPKSDPRYARVVEKLDADGRKLKRHPPASRKAGEPVKAAKGPPNEKAAGARARHVEKLEDAETPKPEATSFLAILQGEIAKAMPKTLGDTEKFMEGGSSTQMKGSLKGNVDEQKNEATGDLKQTSKETPSEAGVMAKPVTPIPGEPAPPRPQVDAAAAMPAPKPDSEVSLEASKQDVAGAMQREKLTDTRLRKANDPRFSGVLASRDAVNAQANAGPAKYRAAETGTLGRAASQAMGIARKGVSMLLGVKTGSNAKVLSRQERQKQKEEQELQSFTAFVVSTFERAKRAVEDRLALLDTKVNEMFDRGIDTALANMKKYVDDRLFDYKMDRYILQIGGSVLWIKDQFLDLPAEVNQFYEAGRKRFTAEMNVLAEQVANLVESQLVAAKADVKRAQAEIAQAQAALSPAIQGRAARTTAEYAEKFAELESGIEDKKQQLAEGLAQKYKEAFDKADESLKAIQDENKGLVTKAKEKIGEVLKALAEFKAKLMGVLRKAANTIDLILEDPIQFLSNLLSAIKKGFNQFSSNITKHLQAGFLRWLFGSLTKLGIEIPPDLTLPSILKLVLGVLGITYERMREKAVKLIGPRAVAAIEKVAEYVGALVKGGPGALWEMVKEDLSNLKAMVIDAIQDWLITTIVKKAVAYVVSLFNPVGAIIKAILLIYDVVTFIVEKAAQILEFVEAVVDSIYNIVTGAIDGAANYIEKALGNMVPLLIGFLAQLLGLGGVADKIKEFIKKVQTKVDKAIDKAIDRVVEKVKKLFGGLVGGGTDDEKKQRLADGVAAGKAALARFSGSGVGAAVLRPILSVIRIRYRLTRLEPVQRGEHWAIRGEINPSLEEKTAAKAAKQDAKAQSLKVGDFVRILWTVKPIGKVTQIEKDPSGRKIRFTWENVKTNQATKGGVSSFDDFGSTWRIGHPNELDIDEEKLKEYNKLEAWKDMNIARRVLNYRYHRDPTVQTNPSGKEWEHIQEKSGRGAHSSENLALTDASFNRDLGVYFGRKYNQGEFGMAGTGGQSLRDFLKGQPTPAHLAWKAKFYDLYEYKFKWVENEIGRYQILVKS
jgi:hypothetical protein